MSAAVLREAAALMRERAEGGESPWRVEMFDQVVAPDSGGERVIADYISDGWAVHVASWHPAVALAVADWLDDEATRAPRFLGPAALAVANAYLGSD